MSDLLKEAIADAKAVRATALQNAKIALEEAFTPKLQSMLSAKLRKEMEGDEDEQEVEEAGYLAKDPGHLGSDLEAGDTDKTEEAVAADDEEVTMEADEVPAMDDEEEVTEADEVPVADDETTEEPVAESDDKDEDDLDLESIIKELEADDAMDAEDEVTEGDGMEKAPAADDAEIKEADGEEVEGEDEKVEEEFDINEIIKALKEEDEIAADEKEVEEAADEKEEDEKEAAYEAKIQEAYKVIRFQKEKINEVNLLNAKLLFMNKVFRAYNLSETQKMKVIENFDRAKTMREVKIIFTTLAESFKSAGKKKISESFASKPTASTKPTSILTEGDALANRFKELANIGKKANNPVKK
jgi:hypothetical protein